MVDLAISPTVLPYAIHDFYIQDKISLLISQLIKFLQYPTICKKLHWLDLHRPKGIHRLQVFWMIQDPMEKGTCDLTILQPDLQPTSISGINLDKRCFHILSREKTWEKAWLDLKQPPLDLSFPIHYCRLEPKRIFDPRVWGFCYRATDPKKYLFTTSKSLGT